MSKNSNRSNNAPDFPVFAGILLGMVMGLAIAGGIAWFVLKKNTISAPIIKEPPQASVPAEKPVSSKPGTAGGNSGSGDGKVHFEFYKELTGKPETSSSKTVQRPPAIVGKPVPPGKPAEKTAVYFLQEGAYTNMDDAEKVKAKLALIGMLANVQPANIPDKGIWYRVRLGPYQNSTEMNEALATLKLNGLNAAPIKAK
jgi:cell division protein FtsN